MTTETIKINGTHVDYPYASQAIQKWVRDNGLDPTRVRSGSVEVSTSIGADNGLIYYRELPANRDEIRENATLFDYPLRTHLMTIALPTPEPTPWYTGPLNTGSIEAGALAAYAHDHLDSHNIVEVWDGEVETTKQDYRLLAQSVIRAARAAAAEGDEPDN
ncbi:hypothetical protein NQ036_06875 [Brevibacterium sp. 91QC2O2]|uniref:hypothetical protein n=1 Tax=Brevibacterium sp. 91QC2O2 TaxID=2968458 RepID=UPI00211B93B4|nr:hypothetical protein [Brevibacterium sp. 91QC2O2]MCQ9367967.1 hypothetical protein [Brevibacterium sp. 91QC2O2]